MKAQADCSCFAHSTTGLSLPGWLDGKKARGMQVATIGSLDESVAAGIWWGGMDVGYRLRGHCSLPAASCKGE